MYAHTRIVSVTLDIECYEDLDLKMLDWREILDLQGDENVDVSIKETVDVYQCVSSETVHLIPTEARFRVLQFQVKQFIPKMIKKGGNPSPVQINLGKYDYNVWVYSASIMGDDNIIRHKFKKFMTKYSNYEDAFNAGWYYVNSRQTQQAWRGSIRRLKVKA